MKQVYATEHTYLNLSGAVERVDVVYTSCEGPIEDYVGWGDRLTPELIATHNIQVTINHRVTHQLRTATVRWFDGSTREGMVRLEDGESYWFNDSLPLFVKNLERRAYQAGDVFTAELYDDNRCVADFNRKGPF